MLYVDAGLMDWPGLPHVSVSPSTSRTINNLTIIITIIVTIIIIIITIIVIIIVIINIPTASELSKLAANAFLAQRISSINSMSASQY